MALEASTKQLIDGLDINQLQIEAAQGRHSRFSEEGLAYVKGRLAQLIHESQDQSATRNLQLIEESNRIARESNRIANESKDTAKLSYRLAALAVVISLIALLMQWIKV